MAEEKPEFQEILARLKKVERQNRTLKRVGLVGMLLATSV